MRAKEFLSKIFESKSNVYVIGDSIANGIAGAGGVSKEYTNPGKNTTFILQNLVVPFVKSGKAKGAIVILSSGAANSGKVETEDGKSIQSENFGPISQQIKLLKDAGASVALVGVADGKTPLQKPTKFTNGKQWTVDYTGANQKLASIASGAGAKFLGSLNTFDANIAKGDGIHPYNGYSKLFQAGSSIAAPAADTKGAEKKDASAVEFNVEVPSGKRGPLIADAQKALEALGVPLPKYGVDGIQGKETTGAIKTFQEKNGIEVTGIVNQQTADKMNAMLQAKPQVLAKLTKSTNKDVKSLDYSRGAEEVAALTSDESTQKARASAEKFLGRPMDDKEWNYLLRATTAEASNNSKEQAYVMGVILNRTRTGNWGDNVISVLRAPSQFQAVTGTRFDPGPSANFTRGPTDRQLANIVDGAINILPQVPTNLKYFTAASSAAYGAGTNIGFRDKMIAAGGEKIGGTIFAAQV
jgi:peptidoglycan hydrolase-like protein with peptidoglycan-binding domain